MSFLTDHNRPDQGARSPPLCLQFRKVSSVGVALNLLPWYIGTR